VFTRMKRDITQRFGFEQDQDGILRRYMREKEEWKPHLQKTKEVILKQAEARSKKKAAVLGSGWLLDVPLPELSHLFEEIYLFDIRHPQTIKQQLSKYSNIQVIETDISGFAASVANLANQKQHHAIEIENLTPTFNFDLSEFDYIVSCNLLNQLDIILLDYLTSHINISHSIEIELRKLIQQTHLNRLPAQKSCLITDKEEVWLNKQHEIIDKKTLLFCSIPENHKIDSWSWHFDNHYKYHNNCSTWLNVEAYTL
jgi:hypothetical protein